MQEGQRVRGVLAGERDGLRVYASRAACGSGSGSIGSSTSGVVSSGPNSNFRIGVLAGERDGLRVYAVGDCYEPTVGTRHFGVLVGERDGKRVYAIDCCVPGSGSSGSGSSGSSGSESSGSSGSSTSVSGSGIGSEGSGSGSFSFSGPSGSFSSGSGPSGSGAAGTIPCAVCTNLLPAQILATVTDKTGEFEGMADSFIMNVVGPPTDPAEDVQWIGFPDPAASNFCSFGGIIFVCKPSENNFVLQNAVIGFGNPSVSSCDPFYMVFNASTISPFCTGSATFTLTPA